jgi:hypothetical protein
MPGFASKTGSRIYRERFTECNSKSPKPWQVQIAATPIIHGADDHVARGKVNAAQAGVEGALGQL